MRKILSFIKLHSQLFNVLFFIIIFCLSLKPVFDPDFGWHLGTGRFIVTRHQIPQTDIFSFSLPNHPYIAHSWLTDVIIFSIYSITKLWGTSIFFALITTLGIYFLSRTIDQLSSHRQAKYFILLLLDGPK